MNNQVEGGGRRKKLPVGGRGHKVPYKTMVMRIPEPCWEQINDFVMEYRKTLNVLRFPSAPAQKLDEIAEIIEEYKKESKTNRDWKKCTQLIQDIEKKIES